jgi:hypothetical protein
MMPRIVGRTSARLPGSPVLQPARLRGEAAAKRVRRPRSRVRRQVAEQKRSDPAVLEQVTEQRATAVTVCTPHAGDLLYKSADPAADQYKRLH